MSLDKEPEIRLQEDDDTRESNSGERKDDNMRRKDPLKTDQREKRTTNPLSLLKEDLSQFTEEVLKMFKDKDTKSECEDRPSSQTISKPASSTLDLLKEDLSQFKEDVSSIFSIGSFKDKEMKTEGEDRPTAPAENKAASSTLDLLKEDLSQLKEDVSSVFGFTLLKDKETKSTEKTINRLSNVFRIGLSKERDPPKDDPSNSFKIKDSRSERPLKSLFRTDLQTSPPADDSLEVQKTSLETPEEQVDDGVRGNPSEKNEETEKIRHNMQEQLSVDLSVCEEKTGRTGRSEAASEEEVTPATQAAEQRRDGKELPDHSESEEDETTTEEEEEEEEEGEGEEEEEEEEEVEVEVEVEETGPWASLSSGLGLISLTDPNKDDSSVRTGDEWSVKNFACYLTLDPNTANSELRLTDCNRRATRVWSDHHPSEHPDRFTCCSQVLCREGLLDSVYWEVEWTGGADIGVCYNNISRGGDTASCLLGHNERSWSLECSEGSYTPCHQNKRFRSSSPRPFSHRVGVYLDWSTGSLSFYCVSQDAMVHLHTFSSTFTEPLYPAFWVWAYDGSVSLCQVELDWERLLQ